MKAKQLYLIKEAKSHVRMAGKVYVRRTPQAERELRQRALAAATEAEGLTSTNSLSQQRINSLSLKPTKSLN